MELACKTTRQETDQSNLAMVEVVMEVLCSVVRKMVASGQLRQLEPTRAVLKGAQGDCEVGCKSN